MKCLGIVVAMLLIIMLGKIVIGLSSPEADVAFRALGCSCCSRRHRGSRSTGCREDAGGRNSWRRGGRSAGMKCLRIVVTVLLILVLGEIIPRCNRAESHVLSCSRRSAGI